MIDFFEISNEMLCLANDRGYFTKVNHAWTRTLGWSADDLTNRPYVEYVHPDDKAATTREARLLAGGGYETIEFENRYRCKEGGYKWLAWRVAPDRETGVWICAAHDVTEQKRQTEAIRILEERFRSVVTHAPVGMAQADAAGEVFFVNAKWCELAGVKPEETLGRRWQEHLHPDDLPGLLTTWQAHVLAGTDMPAYEFRFRHKNGEVRWAWASVAMLKEADGRVTGQIASVEDVTERKNFELSLRAKQDLLRNLIEAQEMERQRLCHEFHDGLIQYAVGAMMSLEGYKSTHHFDGNSAQLDTAISNLQKGVEDGRRTIRGIRPAVLDDSDLAAACNDLVEQFSTPEFRIICRCDPQIGRLPESIQTTAFRLVQEALNNARKHSGSDAVEIDLVRNGDDLQLDVRDFGRGFDAAAVRNQGFGLQGMNERVRLSGGELKVQSQAGVGTHVHISLPIRQDDPDADAV
jgi:PAS domain S-box-containing protein